MEPTIGTEFREFPKIARLNRDCFITEKIDGTNAQVSIDDTGLVIRAGSRNRWITPTDDNYGFAKWVEANREELLKLGPGNHYGEWWGSGCQRGYGLTRGEKRFTLFNVGRWNSQNIPSCVSVVPLLYQGPFNTAAVVEAVETLRRHGSVAAPGFLRPEGVVVYHTAANLYFKVTLDHDEQPKGKVFIQVTPDHAVVFP